MIIRQDNRIRLEPAHESSVQCEKVTKRKMELICKAKNCKVHDIPNRLQVASFGIIYFSDNQYPNLNSHLNAQYGLLVCDTVQTSIHVSMFSLDH